MEERRDKRNIVYFIISYVINNLASGVLYDTFVNYLQEAQTSIATSFWAFYGYATAIYSFYRKSLYIKNKSKNINLFYTKFIPNIERSLTQLKWIDKSKFLSIKI